MHDLVFNHVSHLVSDYMKDREKLFLMKTESDVIEYDVVAEENTDPITVPNLYDRKTDETEEDLPNETLILKKEEQMANLLVPSKIKQPSRKFKDLESLKLIKKALNLEFFKSKISLGNLVNTGSLSQTKPYQLQSKRSRSLILASLVQEEPNTKKNTTFEKGSIEEFNSTFSKRRNKIFSESPIEKLQGKSLQRSTSLSDSENEAGEKKEVVSPRNLKVQLDHYFNIQFTKLPGEDLTTLRNSFEKKKRGSQSRSENFKLAFFSYLESKNLKMLEINQITARTTRRQPKKLASVKDLDLGDHAPPS